jgi:hypothetical protein
VSDLFNYDRNRRAWVEDGHVYVEAYDGRTLKLTPEVAISMGRLLERLGSDSLINKVMGGGPAE